jgi:hypothetical protein
MKTYWIIALFSLACSKTPASDLADAEPEVDTIWSGWNHTWSALSHRVSVVAVRAGSGETAESGILGGDWSTGESWSDDVGYRIHQQDIETSQLTINQGQTELMVGPDGTVSGLSGIEGSPDLVVLQGFEINTDVPQSADYPDDYDPALGYTSRGFGMSVTLVDGQVEATADVRWGPRDRSDVNGALPHAQTGVTVYWATISGVSETERVTYSATQGLAHEPPNSPQEGMSEPLPWSGHGISAISAFDLSLYDTNGDAGGDYLRSFGAEIAPAGDGSAPAEVAGEILTTSFIELGEMSMDVTVDALWLPLDPDLNQVRGHTIEGIHPIGSHTVPLK